MKSDTTKPKLILGITAYQSIALLHGQLKAMSDKFNVFLIAPEHERVTEFCNKENATHLPVSIERNPSPVKDLFTLFALVRILIRVKPDLINFGTMKISFLGMMAAWLAGVRNRIYTCRGFRFEHESGIKKHYLILFEKIISLFSTQIICISKSVADLGISNGIFNEKKVNQFAKGSSNGIDTSLFNRSNVDKSLQLELKRKYELDNKFVYGYVGRLVDRKGINELYKAFSKVYDKNKDARLLIVGPVFEDQIADKSLLDKYDNHPGVIMGGVQHISLIPTYLSLFDLFVLPAWWEGFGNVLIQAAAMGVAVLSTDSTGCKDAVCDGYNGRLITPKSADELYDNMIALRADERLRNKYAINGLEWAQNFDSEIIWAEMLNFYLKLHLRKDVS